ncbi:MAG: MoaD/ThiS family protein [Chloroflexi bacterium]|nr:MoaD/ThiS family protein [Chloroflexota bacterium]
MVRITLKLYATLRPYRARLQSGSTVDVHEGATVRELAEQLDIPAHLVYTVLVNGDQQDEQARLRDGDEVALFPPMAGGVARRD